MDSDVVRVPLERDDIEAAWDLESGALSRRAFLGSGAALGAAVVAPTPSFAAVPTFPAGALYQSVGICTHPNWRTTNWGSLPWQDALIDSGVKHARGDLGHGWGADSGMTHLSKFFSVGGKFCALIIGKEIDKTSAQADIDYLAKKVGARSLSGIESMNEFNNPSTKPSNWVNQLQDFQTWLYRAVRANSALNGVPVVGPSIWGRIRTDYSALGNLEPRLNKGCLHYYCGGFRPTIAACSGTGPISIQRATADAHMLAPTKKLYVTEFGYDTPGPANPISPYIASQRAACKYLVRGIFDLFTNGVERSYIYSLMDDPNSSHRWGLCDATLKPKPQFKALKNTVALIKDNGARLGGLSYTLSANAPRDLKQFVFSKTDGSHLLVFYRDIDSYNRSTLKDVDAAPIYVTVNLGASARKIEFYRPTFESACIGTASGKSVLATIDDQVTILKIIS
jgi:hypothetical protein